MNKSPLFKKKKITEVQLIYISVLMPLAHMKNQKNESNFKTGA